MSEQQPSAKLFGVVVSVTLMLLVGLGTSDSAHARSLASIQDELNRTTGAINDLEKRIKNISKQLDAEEIKLKNAQKRYKDLKRSEMVYPDSEKRDQAIRRSMDDIIRAKKAIQKGKKQFKVATDKWRALMRKKTKLEGEVVAKKKTPPSLDEVGVALEEFYRLSYKQKAAQNNKEDFAINSSRRGGVRRGHGGSVTLEIPHSP